MFELARFSLSDMVRCSNGVRQVASGATSMEAAAQSIVSFLHDSFIDKDLDERSCALVRFYKVHPFEKLEPDLQRSARALGAVNLDWSGVPCLTLLGTAGDEPAWNDRRASSDHAAIPLDSEEAVRRLPMMHRLVEQIGLEVREVIESDPAAAPGLDQRPYDVFLVTDAVGSPHIPAQEDFVLRYGVKSVLGFGGVLPSGSMFAVILFSRTAVSPETAELFRSVALSVKLAALPFVDGPVFDSEVTAGQGAALPRPENAVASLRSRLAAAEQLVAVRGDAVLAQTLRLESTLEDAERRAADLAASETALAQSEARARAIIDASLDAIISMDSEGRITEFNPAAEEVFDQARGDVMGRSLAELIIPVSLRQRHYRGVAEYLRTGRGPVLGKRVELTGMRRSGDEFPVELAITTVDSPDGTTFTGFLRDITERKAAERALRQGRQRAVKIARTLQDSLLPPTLPHLAGLDLASRYHPAGDGSEVGGDFYDVFRTGRGDWGVALGDVCGKGAEAAAVTALARYTIRAAAMASRRPTSILRLLNEAVRVQYPEQFCTVVYGRLRDRGDGWRVTLASGGHPLCLLGRPGEGVVELGRTGILVGQFSEAAFPETTHDLEPGDCLVFYTDGVSEARGPEGTFFGEDRLKALIGGMLGQSAGEIAALVEEAVLAFSGGVASDDMAVLVVRRP